MHAQFFLSKKASYMAVNYFGNAYFIKSGYLEKLSRLT